MIFKIIKQEELEIPFILVECHITGGDYIKCEEKIAEEYFKEKGFNTIKYPFNSSNGNLNYLKDIIGKEKAEILNVSKLGHLDFFVYKDIEDKSSFFFLECKKDTVGILESQINFIRKSNSIGIPCKIFEILRLYEI